MKGYSATFALRRRLRRALGRGSAITLHRKLAYALIIFSISFGVKSLQAVDLAPVMYTPDQPAAGMTIEYESGAQSILRGDGLLIPRITDRSDTTPLEHPPGYSIFLSAIYRVAGSNYFRVQLIQNIINSITPVMLFLIAGFVISWRVGFASGIFAAVWHHLSYQSNILLPDSLTALPILIGVYFLIKAEREHGRGPWRYALAGAMIGLSVWLRPNALMLGPFLAVSLMLWSYRFTGSGRRRVLLALASVLVIAPITIRNYVVYRQFVPVQVGMGLNLWTGIAQGGGERFGAQIYDRLVAAQEAVTYGDPRYGSSWYTPDGIKRDHDRLKKGLAVVATHPLWYAGSVLRRMAHMLNYSADASLVLKATDTRLIDVGAQDREIIDAKVAQGAALAAREQPLAPPGRCLAPGKSLAYFRPLARAAQRLEKETVLIFMFVGAVALFLLSSRRAFLLLMTPAYYFLAQSLVHTEIRYTLPMHYFLFVCAAIGWVVTCYSCLSAAKYLRNRLLTQSTQSEGALQPAKRP